MAVATLTDLATLKAAGYTVAKLDSGCGPVEGAWTLTGPDGDALMIGDHGGVAPTQWEAVAEGLARIAADLPAA